MANVRDSEVAQAIWDGKHDADLNIIQHACQQRLKMMFRRGTKMRLTGTKSVELEGKTATIIKVNPKRITIGVGEPETDQFGTTWSGGEFNVPPSMLEPLQT
jgi:hypothetical protein